MIKKPGIKSRVSLNIAECTGQGISPKIILDGFARLKSELEALDCEVSIKIDGKPFEDFQVIEWNGEREP